MIAKPLELKIFEKEINRVLLEQKNDMTLANQEQIATQFTPRINELNAEIASLKEEVSSKEAEVNALYSTYIAEAEGTAGTKRLGKSPVYPAKREKHDSELLALKELKETNAGKIEAAEEKIASLNEDYQTKVNESQPYFQFDERTLYPHREYARLGSKIYPLQPDQIFCGNH